MDIMDKAPIISVIVPVYHVEKELRRCLDSLLRQSFSDYEIILINDGGNETETAICEEYAVKYKQIKYRYQTNQGLSAARNVGLSMARGSWVMFVDSDDWVHEDFCLKAFAAVDKYQAQMAIFDLAYTVGNAERGTIDRSQLEEGVYPGKFVLRERLLGKIVGYVWNKIYKKDLWDGIFFPVGENWEDVAVLHKVLDRADKIVIIHDVLYYKPKRQGSITEIAFRTGECSKWSYIQRKKRYLYIKKRHPDMLDIVNNDIASAAVQYAVFLIKKREIKSNIYNISEWLRAEKIYISEGSIKRRIAFFLLLNFPRLFIYVVQTFYL